MPPHDFDKLHRAGSASGIVIGFDYMALQVIFQELNNQTVRCPAHRSGKVQDVCAGGAGLERTLDCLHLPFQTTDASQECSLVVRCVTHRVGGYPINSYPSRMKLWLTLRQGLTDAGCGPESERSAGFPATG